MWNDEKNRTRKVLMTTLSGNLVGYIFLWLEYTNQIKKREGKK